MQRGTKPNVKVACLRKERPVPENVTVEETEMSYRERSAPHLVLSSL